MVPRCVTVDYSSNRHAAITAPDARYLVVYVYNGCDKEHCLHLSSRRPSDTMAISRELSEITSSRDQTPLQWFQDRVERDYFIKRTDPTSMVPRCVTLDYSSNRHPAITAPDARYLVMYVFNGCDKEHCLHISSRRPSDTMAISRVLSEITSSRDQTPLQWFQDVLL
ncbi:hypothetical protein J6590_006650 [Homalodisca vitripennis]|nr:hypothetical protein J6590_006650 [Homalodisca vitripennis]